MMTKIKFDGWGRRLFVWVAALCLSHAISAKASSDAALLGDTSVRSDVSQNAMAEQAQFFWQVVVANPNTKKTLIKRHFSPGLLLRSGETGLIENLSMLSEMLGSEIASSLPEKVLGSASEGELQYRLKDGRRIALKLTLTETDPPLIGGFGVMPLPLEVAAVAPEQLPAAIATHLKAESVAGRFSGSVIVARGEKLLYAQGFGMADRKTGRANTLDTPINLGSINKMFTAIAIAQLQAAGKLDWQDTVGKHLPNFPNAKIRDQVTIHQLLTHTSGVGSYWNKAYKARRDHIDSQQEFLDTFVNQPLLFEPGKGLEYSNGGPVILGLIIEALSGSDYYTYVREHIYLPAGMQHADHYRRNDAKAGFAQGYLKTENGQWQDNRKDLGMRGSAAGGGYASARDLLAFTKALGDERLLTHSQLNTLWRPYTQPGGPVGYGYLFSVGNTAGKRWIGHDGGAPGISAEFMYYPEDGLVIIVLANQDNAATSIREWLYALLDASLLSVSP